jgi:cytidine deaminase
LEANALTDIDLINHARKARGNAYAPYSNFQVGAALLCADGRVYPGCNVENGATPVTVCAERTALVSAVANGAREFTAIAVIGSGDFICTPCGICRQALYEFAPELRVICADPNGAFEVYALCELLPRAFGPRSLG